MISILPALGWATEQSGLVRSGTQPIPGATVRVLKDGKLLTSTITDEDGRWTLEGFPDTPTPFTFEVEMFGFQPKKADLTIPAFPSALEFELSLKAPPAPRPAGRRGGPGGFQ